MEVRVKEAAVYIRKYLLFSLKSTYKFTCSHPFVASFAFSLFLLYSCYPSLFAFLVSSFPVLFCTALLLGILLSYGEPNIPEIEEEGNTNRKVSSLKVEYSVDDLFVKKDESFTLEDLADSRVGTEERISKDSAPYGEKEREIDFFAVSSSIEEQNKHVENLEVLMKKERSESYMRSTQVSDKISVGIEGLMVKIKKPELDDWLDSSLGPPWQPINIRDASSDSETDRAESSSPDASMSDILPMLDELSPLLDSETPHNAPKSADNSDLELSQHHESDEESVDKEDEYKNEEKDESNKIVAWTADDLKNVMDLGSSDLERNRRLESLIARRRARKSQIIIYEKDLIDVHSNDTTIDEFSRFHPQVHPIFAPRGNPFDLPHDLDEFKGLPPIPGSAPSVLLRRQNPFDFPCDSKDSNKSLAGEEGLHQPQFGLPSQRGYLFRRHESFASHSAFSSNLLHENLGSSRLNPYFAAEMMDSEGNDYVDFHNQLNGESDTKSSSVPTSETVSSAIDPENQKVPTEQETPDVMALSVPLHHTKPTEQSSQFYENDLVDSRPELGEDGHYVDPNASAVSEETYQGIDTYDFVKKTIEQIQFGQKHEVVEEKYDDLTLFSSSESIEKSLDISLEEVLETQEQSTRVSKPSSESMHASDASASHLICETQGVDNNQAVVPIYDSSPSGSEIFLANIFEPGDNFISSGREGFHSVSVKSHVQEDAMEVVSHAKELEKIMISEMNELKVVHGNKIQDSTSNSEEILKFPTYMNLLDENISAAMGVSETGEQDFNESSSLRIEEGFGDLTISLEIGHSSSLSSAEADIEPRFAFSAGFPSSEVEEKHQSMEELKIHTFFGIYLDESRISNLELGPIPEENSEDFKVEEEHMSLVQNTTTLASNGIPMLEAPDVSLFSVAKEVVTLYNQSKEEAQNEGSEDLVFLSEKAKPSTVSAYDDMFNELDIGELIDNKELSNQSKMKFEPDSASNDDINDSQYDIINEFQINQDAILRNLNNLYSEHGDVDADIGEIQDIDEHLLSELDAVGDFQVEGLKSRECPHMKSLSDRLFVCSGEDSELRCVHASEMSLNKPITANLISLDEMDLVFNTEEPTESGYWSLAMSPVEDLTVYNPKLNVLEACSPEELDSIFKQKQPGDLAEPSLSNTITDKLVTENSYVGLRNVDMVDQEIEAILQETVLLTLTRKNAEDISSSMIEDGRDFDIFVSPHFDLQHNDNHSSMDGCKSDLTVVDSCGYDSTEIQSSEIKVDHVESVSGLISYSSAITEAETSSGELDISSRDFEIEETESELLVLEAKSIEDIHLPFKHVTGIVVNNSISSPIIPDNMITHPDTISPEIEKTSGLLVLEAKSAEDINSAFKQAAEKGLVTSAVHFSDPEKITNHPDFEVVETRSPDTENLSELFVVEARSAEDMQLAFNQVIEEISAMPTYPLIDSELSKTNQDHEIVEAMYSEAHNIRELLVPEGKSSENTDSAFEQADVDLDKLTSQVFPGSLANQIDSQVVDMKALERLIDQELLVLDVKYVENIDSCFKSSSEGGLLRSTSLEIDPNHDAVKNKSLQSSTNSEQLVLETESVEETSTTLKQVTGGLFDMSSPLVVPDATGAYEVAHMTSLGVENDSDMISLKTKSFQHLNSACKKDTETDLVQPNLQELENFQPGHDALEERSLDAIDKPEPFALKSKSFNDTHSSYKQAAADSIGQSTTALVDPGHNPGGQEVLDVKSPGSSNNSEFPVLEAKSLEKLNIAFRQAIEGCLSKAESEVDTEHDSVGESLLAAEKYSELIALEERYAENIQSTFSDAYAGGVYEGSSSLPVDPESMEIYPGRKVEDNMLVVVAKSLEDIHSAFKQATDVATSPLLVESRSLDMQTESCSSVLEAKSNELTDLSMKEVHQEGSKKSTFFTDSPSLQAISDHDSKLLVLEEKSDNDSTFTQVTEGCLDRSVTLEDHSKPETIPELKSVTESNFDANQDAEVEYAKEIVVSSNEAVTGENSSSENQINRRTDDEEASTENPSSSGQPSVKDKKKFFEKSDSSTSSSSSSSDSE